MTMQNQPPQQMPGPPQQQQQQPEPDLDPADEHATIHHNEMERGVYSGGVPFWAPNEFARKAFHEDFAQVQAKITNPQRDAENPHYGSRYASLEGLLAEVRPLLNQYNFTLTQGFGVRMYNSAMTFGTYIFHSAGAVMSSVVGVPQLDNPQQMVSYSTYMRRVQLTAMLGVRDEDDDGNAATGSPNSGGGGSAPWETVQNPQQQMPAGAPPWQQQQQQPPQAPPAAAPPMQPPPGAPPAAPNPGYQQQQQQAPWQQQAPPQTPPLGALSRLHRPSRLLCHPNSKQQPPGPPPAPQQPPQQLPPIPEGALQGDMLQEAQNMLAAVEQTFGPDIAREALSRSSVPTIAHMLAQDYATFVERVNIFATSQQKSMNLTGPEGGKPGLHSVAWPALNSSPASTNPVASPSATASAGFSVSTTPTASARLAPKGRGLRGRTTRCGNGSMRASVSAARRTRRIRRSADESRKPIACGPSAAAIATRPATKFSASWPWPQSNSARPLTT